jgi:hypothetical protein
VSANEIARIAGFALAGLVLGAASFATLRLNAALYLGAAPWRSAALHVLRLAGLGALLVWTARQGAGPLLALAAGLTAARLLVVPRLARPK